MTKKLTDGVGHLVVDGVLAERKGGHQVDAEPEGKLDEPDPPVQDELDAILVTVGSLQGPANHQNCRLTLRNPEIEILIFNT